ncbi:hypothetical protein ABH309_20175 [Chromobacterium piscinae]|uniref:Uncharacterized protein n=1 Tax=Chromobacterium piscinae TaxID=686831 RepID=A0ABV0HA28_9NEIS
MAVGSPVPDGWVITRAMGNFNTIHNVARSSYGRQITVMLGSPIPANWVVARANGNSSIIKRLS